MTPRRLLSIPTGLVIICLAVGLAFGHPGGRDAYGGHNDRRHGGYHFHSGPLAGQSFPDKEAALAALRAQQNGSAQGTGPRPTQPGSQNIAERRLDALVRVLIAKGIVTREELEREMAQPGAAR